MNKSSTEVRLILRVMIGTNLKAAVCQRLSLVDNFAELYYYDKQESQWRC